MKLPIYLDYAATTPVDPRVAEAMATCLTIDGTFGNPASSTHVFGWKAAQKVAEARAQIATAIGADPKEIIWTSGATEATNLAIKGVARFHQQKGKHIITCQTEHKATLDTCKYLEKQGFQVTYLAPDATGLLDLSAVEAAIRDDTILISIMHVNNEIGVIQDLHAMGQLARAREILFHVDAAQSLGKLPINVDDLHIDLMSLSAHKIYGPKGMGALYIRSKPRVRLEALIHGGGHERGFRSGTLPTHQIVGFGEAVQLVVAEMPEESQRIKGLRDRLWHGLKDIEAIQLNSLLDAHGAPNIINISFNYIEGESLIMALKDVAVSTGSACTSASLKTSHVLHALGLKDEIAHSSLRFSIGRFTTTEEIDYVIALVREKVAHLREMSPLWDMYKAGVDLDSIEWGHA